MRRIGWLLTVMTLTCCLQPGPAALRAQDANSRSMRSLRVGGGQAEKGNSWLSMPKMPKLPWSADPKRADTGPTFPSESLPGQKPSPAKIESGQLAVARLAERRGQDKESEEIYRALIRKNPGLIAARHRLGVLEAKRGNFAEAQEHFQTALLGEPRNVELLSDAGYCCFLQDRFVEAEDFYQRALEIDPDNKALCNNFGLLLAEQQRYVEALQVFQRVNTNAQAHANLAFMLAQQGQLEQAQAAYNRALTLDPQLRHAAQALIQLDGYQKNQRLLAASRATQPASDAVVPVAPAEVLPGRPLSPQRNALAERSPAPVAEPFLQTSYQDIAPVPPAAVAVQPVVETQPASLPHSIQPREPAGRPQQDLAGPLSQPSPVTTSSEIGPVSPQPPRKSAGLRLTDQPILLPAQPETNPSPSAVRLGDQTLRR